MNLFFSLADLTTDEVEWAKVLALACTALENVRKCLFVLCIFDNINLLFVNAYMYMSMMSCM